MGIGVSLFLLAVGAILTFAVNATVSGVDDQHRRHHLDDRRRTRTRCCRCCSCPQRARGGPWWSTSQSRDRRTSTRPKRSDSGSGPPVHRITGSDGRPAIPIPPGVWTKRRVDGPRPRALSRPKPRPQTTCRRLSSAARSGSPEASGQRPHWIGRVGFGQADEVGDESVEVGDEPVPDPRAAQHRVRLSLDLDARTRAPRQPPVERRRATRWRGDAVPGAVCDQDVATASCATGSPASHQGASATTPVTCSSPATPERRARAHRMTDQQDSSSSAMPVADLRQRPARVADRVRRSSAVGVPAADAIAEPIRRNSRLPDRPGEREHPNGGELMSTRGHLAADPPALQDQGHPCQRADPTSARADEAGRAPHQSTSGTPSRHRGEPRPPSACLLPTRCPRVIDRALPRARDRAQGVHSD